VRAAIALSLRDGAKAGHQGQGIAQKHQAMEDQVQSIYSMTIYSVHHNTSMYFIAIIYY
jgi:hypothetical protein